MVAKREQQGARDCRRRDRPKCRDEVSRVGRMVDRGATGGEQRPAISPEGFPLPGYTGAKRAEFFPLIHAVLSNSRVEHHEIDTK